MARYADGTPVQIGDIASGQGLRLEAAVVGRVTKIIECADQPLLEIEFHIPSLALPLSDNATTRDCTWVEASACDLLVPAHLVEIGSIRRLAPLERPVPILRRR